MINQVKEMLFQSQQVISKFVKKYYIFNISLILMSHKWVFQ